MYNWIKKGILFNGEFSQLPIVEDDGKFYKIYYSTRDNQGRSIPKYIIVDKNFKETSEPCFVRIPLGKPGTFDSYGVMPSSIVTLEDGTKYMYYVGWSKRIDVPYWNSTGLAISKDDGITWDKFSEGPIFGSCSKEPNWVGTVDVRKILGDTWIMMYSSCKWERINGKLEPIYGINDAFSNDGINWRPNGEINSLKNNEGGIASFRKLNSKYYYSKRNKSDYRTNPKNSYKIYCYNDLWNGETTLELEPSGDENMNAYPYVISKDDRDIMFYNGKNFGDGIYYAIKMK